jgi:hypothetical protein
MLNIKALLKLNLTIKDVMEMRLNWLGVIMILVGIAIFAAHQSGGDWFNFLLKLWPIVFVMRGINNWEREDQTKAFQAAQIGLGSFLIADNFLNLPNLDSIWMYWPILLIAWGLSVIFTNENHRSRVCFNTATDGIKTGFVLGDAEPQHYHLIRELWPSTISGQAYIEFSAGILDLSGVTDQFFEGEILTSMGEPRILYKAESQAVFQMIQSGIRVKNLNDVPNRWELKFTKHIPLAFKVEANAGKANLDFREHRLTRLELEGNAGRFDVTLGDREKNVELDIECNAGRAEVVIPKNAGVELTGECALGSFEFKGGTLENVSGVRRTIGFDDALVKIKIMYEANASSLTIRREE